MDRKIDNERGLEMLMCTYSCTCVCGCAVSVHIDMYVKTISTRLVYAPACVCMALCVYV